MKRVKETRGRSRQTNDLSASFSASKMMSPMNSPPTSPQLQRYTASQPSPSHAHGNSITSPPVSPSPMRRNDAPSSVMIGTQSPPDASHEKTPMPTPKLEKRMELSLTSSLPSSSEKPSSTASGELQPENISISGTSPTSSSHSNGPSSGGSNDITPMPTPRAGSPIAGLKMTTSIFEQHQKSSKDFQLVDTFTTRATASTSGRTQNLKTKEEEDIKVPPVLNVLALGGLLDDAAATLEAGSMNASVKSDKALKAGFTAGTETAESNDVHSSESRTKPEQSSSEEEISSSNDGEEEGSDYDKTPTLHASLELPKLNETTRALHARYKKKRTVGIPHVTAKKKPITPSRKSKKA